MAGLFGHAPEGFGEPPARLNVAPVFVAVIDFCLIEEAADRHLLAVHVVKNDRGGPDLGKQGYETGSVVLPHTADPANVSATDFVRPVFGHSTSCNGHHQVKQFKGPSA